MTNNKTDTTIATNSSQIANQNTSIDRKRWMRGVPDAIKINQLTIPGTHNSGAYSGINNLADAGLNIINCQSNTIKKQLSDGIRLLDIRIGTSGVICHASAALAKDGSPYALTINDVVSDCVNFLKENPSETIFVMLGNEQKASSENYKSICKSAFGGAVAKYVFDSDAASWKSITLGQTRGKIALIDSQDSGLNAFSYISFIKQNFWDIGNASQTAYRRAELKYNAIFHFIQEARKNPDTFVVKDENGKVTTHENAKDCILYNGWNKQWNFITSVEYYANAINTWLSSDPTRRVINYPRGIQLMDYYHQRNVDNMIRSNYAGAVQDMVYTFTIKTGTLHGSGTDSKITLALIGDRGRISEFCANPYTTGNAFENNKTDVFSLIFPDIGNITELHVRSDMSYLGPAWYPQYIEVRKSSVVSTETCKRFNMNVWFEDKNTRVFK